MADGNFSDVLVRTLAEAGVTEIYGIVGDSLNPISNAIRKDGRINFIHVRHEESGAFAASAQAQLTGNLAVCAGSAGPGSLHLINGLYDANRSHAPVLAIVSDIPSSQVGTDYAQAIHPTEVFRSCGKFCEYVGNPEQMPEILQLAIQTAISERGVAVIVVPGDLGEREISADSMARLHKPILAKSIPEPSVEEIAQLALLIDKASRITFFCGAGCCDAHDDVIALAQKIKAPIAHTLRGKEVMGADNPLEVGMTGLLGWGGAVDAINSCDLFIMLGTDFPYSAWLPTKCKVAQVDICARNLGKRTKVDFGVCGDVGDVCRKLLKLVDEKTDRSHLDYSLEKTKRAREELDVYLKDVSCNKLPHPEYAESLIDKGAADDAIITVPVGLGTIWGSRYLTAKKNRRIIGSFTHGSLGGDFTMAIGAQIAYPKRQVVAICGDGGFAMLMGDLLTIVQYNLPIKIFLFDNSTLGFIDLEMMAAGFVPFKTSLKNPDFAKMADSIGIKGIRVDDGCKLQQAIDTAFSTEGAVLVDIVTDPHVIALPPKISGEQVKNFSLAMGKLVASGKWSDALEIVKENSRTLSTLI